MMNMAFALRCKWATRRLQRYLDMDPAAPLSESEVSRVRAHIADCEKCSTSVADYKQINSALRRLGASKVPDEMSLLRLKSAIDQIAPLKGE